MRIEEHRGQITATADQILGEIRDYCRATKTAESTFGRLVVNDGKLVSRLRDGARITTGTLDKVRAASKSAVAKPVNGAFAPIDVAPPVSGSSTTGRNIFCSSRPAVKKPKSQTGFLSNSAVCSLRRRRSGSSTQASATALCCRA